MLLLLYEDQELHVKRTSNTKIWIMLMQALILNKPQALEKLNNQRQHCSERSTGLSLLQKENGL